MSRFSTLYYDFNGGGSPLLLLSVDKTGGSSLSYYYSAIFYVYLAVFLMYLIWALMLFMEETISSETTILDESAD